ncbi:MAG: histone deacetylase [Saprospiraceae bacterium]|nr:histone deacetylase [Saprospiraceae bacterium]
MAQKTEKYPLPIPGQDYMQLIYNPVVLKHDTGAHPESRKRFDVLGDIPVTDLLDGAPYLGLVHTPTYIRELKTACQYGQRLDPDTAISVDSFEAARYAVGATMMASESNGFALVRPPGHHAYSNRGSGFCLLNNVAVAAARLVEEGKRVVIFDFDGHLGDGTMDIFYDSDQVLVWSMHQFPAYPGHGFTDEIGMGKGKGFTINVPLPPGSADDIMWDAFQFFLPVVKEFQPDVIAISAGFDAHQSDFLLDLKASAGWYYRVGQALRQINDRLFATLEGGYDVEIMPKCLFNFLAGINGHPQPFEEEVTHSGMRVWETFEINVHSVMANLRPYWKI